MHPAGPMNALFKDLDTFAVISSTCEYMCEFSAVVERDNYLGVQFHPEKSGAPGAQLLHNFHEIVRSHSCK